MAKFITLHTADKIQYVNMDLVVSMRFDEGYKFNPDEPWFHGREPATCLYFIGNDENPMRVIESPEEILKAMEE